MKQAKYITANRRQRGFTIIELMITVTLVAVLASIAVPSMQTFVRNSRISSTTQDLLRSIQTARSEATKQQSKVVLCASANPSATTPTCTTGTATGWIVFVDADSNWQHASSEALLESYTFDSKLYVLADQSHLVSYAATGFGSPGDATATPSTAIVICDSRGNVDSNGGSTQTNSVARGIIITNTGRARVTQVRNSSTDSNDIADLLSDPTKINSTCPP